MESRAGCAGGTAIWSAADRPDRASQPNTAGGVGGRPVRARESGARFRPAVHSGGGPKRRAALAGNGAVPASRHEATDTAITTVADTKRATGPVAGNTTAWC